MKPTLFTAMGLFSGLFAGFALLAACHHACSAAESPSRLARN